jgi:regulator of protease activity HflC (stomatin/prohibitin superfamily)
LKISKKDDELETDKSLLKPIRVTTAAPKADNDDGDILNVRLTLEPTITIIWQVQMKDFFEFFINIDGTTWPEKRAFLLKQMRDVAETVLAIEVAKHTAGELNGLIGELGERVKTVLNEKMEDWGILVCDVTIQNLGPDHATNIALGKVPQARATKVAEVTEAEGKKQAAILRAEGEAEGMKIKAAAREVELEAEGKGNRKAADALGMSGKDYIAAQVAKEAIGKGDVILGAKGIAQMVGLGKHIFQKEGVD